MLPDPKPEGFAPVSGGLGQILAGEGTVAQLEQGAPELPAVEALPPVAHDGTKGSGNTGEPDPLAWLERPIGTQLLGSSHLEDEVAGQRQEDRCGEALLGQLDSRSEDGAEWQSSEALVEGQPSVDGSRDRDAADVATERYDREPFLAQAVGVHTRTSAADGEQGHGVGAGC